MSEYNYPLVFKAIDSGHIVEFTGLKEGVIISVGNSGSFIGYKSKTWVPHNDISVWRPVNQHIVYEWLYKEHNKPYQRSPYLMTEDEAKEFFKLTNNKYQKSGKQYNIKENNV